jgi:hypothetical protein
MIEVTTATIQVQILHFSNLKVLKLKRLFGILSECKLRYNAIFLRRICIIGQYLQ